MKYKNRGISWMAVIAVCVLVFSTGCSQSNPPPDDPDDPQDPVQNVTVELLKQDIGLTLAELTTKYPGLKTADQPGPVFGSAGTVNAYPADTDEYMWMFFLTQYIPGLNAFVEAGFTDRLKVTGLVGKTEFLLPQITKDVTFEEFQALLPGMSEFSVSRMQISPGISFIYDGFYYVINCEQQEIDNDELDPPEVIKPSDLCMMQTTDMTLLQFNDDVQNDPAIEEYF